ncbi:MAG: ATP-binding cassette domain-containing protein, partial [Planctomycetes bacterium]|nr:ATP-binding cassette domain-containing protein [Planctomycetota bacterium]
RNQGRVQRLKQMRSERAQMRDRAGSAQGGIREAERSGRLVLRAQGLTFGYGDEKLVDGLDLDLFRGDRIGLVGPNGVGKSTLVKLLLGELEAQAGTLRHGTNVEVARFEQLAESLDPSMRVQDAVADGLETITTAAGKKHVIGYLGDFLFSPEQVRSPVSKLSGGEKNRLLLARILAQPCNLLVLDEPTNDLDLETLEFLENLLSEFSGTLILVSHDREFLDNVVTSCLVFEGEGCITEYGGGYQDAERARREREAQAAPAPPPKATKAPREKTASKKLSYKEARELEALPARIDALETEQTELHARLADPAIYRDDPAGVPAIQARLSTVAQELLTAYETWERLETRRVE